MLSAKDSIIPFPLYRYSFPLGFEAFAQLNLHKKSLSFVFITFKIDSLRSISILRENCRNAEFFWSVFSRIFFLSKNRKIRTRKNSAFGHFLCLAKNWKEPLSFTRKRM